MYHERHECVETRSLVVEVLRQQGYERPLDYCPGIIRDIVRVDYPVCFDFPVSHERENYALKVGIKYKLKVSREEVTLVESWLM